jgi:hypothetical protein
VREGERREPAKRAALAEGRVTAGNDGAELRRHVLEEVDRLLTGVLSDGVGAAVRLGGQRGRHRGDRGERKVHA